jgi:nicotinamide-nucleotide amidase
LSRPRAVIVVTGSELVRGERTDLNGPFLAREALRLGLEPVRIAIVGDLAQELEAVLRAALEEGDAVLTSGGLGPTHDDRTVELVAKALGCSATTRTSRPESRSRQRFPTVLARSGWQAQHPAS